ncbi:mannose-6-phosphate isomerase, class I [Ectobacillus sp. JY-23]|uniref:mannose-6-phosphate isomerase, class I n=1 Tax=Ectobacillus sp. JY-23 TaxID=2933872 RepID=UPI001FF3F6CF|nr:mannose-6-phosphate isomerase, class I [Ectobacillus sp. JY-23]UOY93088.1 mannose-6-phosphate isomerase, class I [Ectobacillus sp. JY-23]
MSILQLSSHFEERIWGGRKLQTHFGYDIPDGNIGECWGISAHPNGESIIQNGPYKGLRLSELWKRTRDSLFGKYEVEEFPLLVKILDAADDLSVQVHPNDEQAKALEGEAYGKTECWYVLDAEPGAHIIYGHKANTKKELNRHIQGKSWAALFHRQPVKRGDFIFVESGTVHAIGAGIVILEIQQSCDTTYRIYDYDRVDAQGKTRELHLDKAMQVIHIGKRTESDTHRISIGNITRLVKCPYFTVWHQQLSGECEISVKDHFQMVSVIEGKGMLTVDGTSYPLQKGHHFIITREAKYVTTSGNMEWIIGEVEESCG